MDRTNVSSGKAEKMLWLILVALFSLFCINSTNVNGQYILIALTGFALVVSMVTRGLRKITFDPFQKYLFAMALFCFLSTSWAINEADAMEKGITLTSILLCFSVFYYYFRYSSNQTEKMVEALLWAGYVVVVYSFLYYGFSGVLTLLSAGMRLDSEFDNVNTIGMICSITTIISAHYIINKGFRLRFLLTIPTVLLLSATGSRTSLITCILGVCILISVKYVSGGFISSMFKVFFILTILLGAVFLLAQLPVFSGINERMMGLFSLFTGKGEVDGSAQLRDLYRLLGLQIFSEHPILGIGMGNTHIYTYQYYRHDCYLHNNFVEMLANGGIVGFILYYSIYVYIVTKLIKQRLYVQPMGKLIGIIVFVMLLTDYGSVSYYSKVSYFILMVVLIYLQENKYKTSFTYG